MHCVAIWFWWAGGHAAVPCSQRSFVLCLATGTGAATGVFAVLEPVLLRPQPFERPGELYQIAAFSRTRTNPKENYWVSWLPTRSLIEEGRVLSGVAAFYERDLDVVRDGTAERVPGAEVVAGSFAVLGVRPLMGRLLDPRDVERGRRTALIGEAYWSSHFGRSPDVLGQTLELTGQAYQIVGVLPGVIRFPSRADIWAAFVPEDFTANEQRGTGVLAVIGRLPPTSNRAALAHDLDALAVRMRAVDPVFFGDFGYEAVPLNEYLVGSFRRPLWALFGGALFLLLLATANVANLMLARAESETWQHAVRTALGAPRHQLTQQVLVENLTLALSGALLGGVLGAWGVKALLAVAPPNNPAFDRVGFSPSVLGWSLLLGGAVALLLAKVPVVRGAGSIETLRHARGSSMGRRERRLQNGFVVGQVALSLMLLIGATLMMRSFARLRAVPPGFDATALFIARVSAPALYAGTPAGRTAFTRTVLDQVRTIPGVVAAAAVSSVPFEDGDVGFNYSVQDQPPTSPSERTINPGRFITPGWFLAMGVRLLAGRDFTDADRRDAAPVAIVSRSFEQHYWPGGSALGRRIKRGAYGLDRPWIEIVGVVDNVRSGTLGAALKPQLYYPLAQSDVARLSALAYTVRTRGDPARLTTDFRAAVRAVSPVAAVYGVSTGDAVMRIAMGQPEFNSLVIAVFAIAGLLLAAAGIYGSASFAVGRRTREFGLRMALGARPRQVLRIVLGSASLIALLGIGIGLAGAAMLTHLLGELLFEVSPVDVPTYALVATLLAATVLIASWVPARRATRVDPTTALRED